MCARWPATIVGPSPARRAFVKQAVTRSLQNDEQQATGSSAGRSAWWSYYAGMDPLAFEREVRRLLETLHPGALGGQAMQVGRERDAVYHTADGHLLAEVTTDTRQAKARYDAEKLASLGKQRLREHPGIPVKA